MFIEGFSPKSIVLCTCYLIYPHMLSSFERKAWKMPEVRECGRQQMRSGFFFLNSTLLRFQHQYWNTERCFSPKLYFKNPLYHTHFRCSPRTKAWTWKQLTPDPLTNPITCWLVSCVRLFAKSLLHGVSTCSPITWFQGLSSIGLELALRELPLTVSEIDTCRDARVVREHFRKLGN